MSDNSDEFKDCLEPEEFYDQPEDEKNDSPIKVNTDKDG